MASILAKNLSNNYIIERPKKDRKDTSNLDYYLNYPDKWKELEQKKNPPDKYDATVYGKKFEQGNDLIYRPKESLINFKTPINAVGEFEPQKDVTLEPDAEYNELDKKINDLLNNKEPVQEQPRILEQPNEELDPIEGFKDSLKSEVVEPVMVEDNKWYKSSLLPLLLAQAASAYIGSRVSGYGGATAGSKAGTFAIDKEIGRQESDRLNNYKLMESANKRSQGLSDKLELMKTEYAYKDYMADKKYKDFGKRQANKFLQQIKMENLDAYNTLERDAKIYGYDLNKINVKQLNDIAKMDKDNYQKIQRMGIGFGQDLQKIDKKQSFQDEMQQDRFKQQIKMFDKGYWTDLSKMAKKQGYDIEKMDIGQIYKLEQMDKGQAQNLIRMAKKHGYDLSKIDKTFDYKGKMQDKDIEAKDRRNFTDWGFKRAMQEDKFKQQDKYIEAKDRRNFTDWGFKRAMQEDKFKQQKELEDIKQSGRLDLTKFKNKKNEIDGYFIDERDPSNKYPRKAAIKSIEKVKKWAEKDKSYQEIALLYPQAKNIEKMAEASIYQTRNKEGEIVNNINESTLSSAIKQFIKFSGDNRISDPDYRQHERAMSLVDWIKNQWQIEINKNPKRVQNNLSAAIHLIKQNMSDRLNRKINGLAKNASNISKGIKDPKTGELKKAPRWIYRDFLSNDIGIDKFDRNISNRDSYGRYRDKDSGMPIYQREQNGKIYQYNRKTREYEYLRDVNNGKKNKK